jgi:hypothetical protein
LRNDDLLVEVRAIGINPGEAVILDPAHDAFGDTNPIQAEKFRPDRKAFGSATVATTAVASTGPTPELHRASCSSRWIGARP